MIVVATVQRYLRQRPVRAVRTVRGRRTLIVAVVAVAVIGAGGCKGGGEEAAPAKRGAAPVIERVDGMKYYVGGPIMSPDRYGRMRLGGFNGEVSAPTVRGLLIGFKRQGAGGRDFDYRTYVNGRIISSSTGFLDEKDLLWFRERFTYDATGKIIARQTMEYDDESETTSSRVEHLDPVSGEVVKTIESKHPYRPLDDDEDDSFFDDEDEAEEGEEQGAD